MPFPRTLTSAEKTLIRTGDYRASTNLAYCPQAEIFHARVATSIASGVFAEVEFDTVTVGAFGDILPGMTVYIGNSSDIRFATLITRVRKAADSNTLFIGESAAVIQDGDHISVVNDYWLWEKLGRISGGSVLVDWETTFKKPAPLIGNLQSAYIDPRPSGDATLTFSPTGYPMAQDATTTLTWLWDVDDGTITVGTTTTQQITATFPQGQRWVRVTVTDSNGNTNFRVLWVNVGLSYTLQNIENPPISGNLEDGWNCSLNVWDAQSYEPLRSLPEQTLCVIYTSEVFGDGSTSPIVTNIDFIGRTRGESSHTIGDEQWSTIQTGSLELEGFGAQLNRLSSPQLTVTHSTSPTAWGSINRPTIPRLIGGHLCAYFNTLSTLCSLHFDIPFTYRATTTNADATVTVADTSVLVEGMSVTGTGIPGGTTISSITNKTTFELSANATASATNTLVFTPENSDNRFISSSLTVTETSAGTALDKVARWINAGLDYAQSGEIEIRRHAFYRDTTDRGDLATVIDINQTTNGDLIEYTLGIDYPDMIGRAFGGSEVFSTSLNQTQYLTGSAPPVARGNGEGQATEDGQILTADATLSANITELNVRIAALYADSQPKDRMDILLYDAWRGVLSPSRSRWITLTLAASNNLMGRVYTSSTRWICTTVNYNAILETGEMGTRATLIKEPALGSAQVASAIAPAVMEPALPDLPAINPYPAMELAGSINYPVDEPDLEDIQPIDPFSQSYGDEEVGGNYPPPGCRNYNILLNDSTGITTPALTNAATITVRSSGYGQVSAGSWSDTEDLAAGDGGFDPVVTSVDLAIYSAGVGWTRQFNAGGFGFSETRIVHTFASPATFTRVRARITTVTSDTTFHVRDSSGEIASTTVGVKTNEWVSLTGVFTDDELRLDLANTTPGDFTMTFHELEIFGLGTAPAEFAGAVSTGATEADSYYYFLTSNVNEGFPYTGFGLTFDGNEPNTIPPYNTNHIYNTTITGDGTTVVVKFSDTDYSDNVAVPLKVRMCGSGL